MSALNKLRTAGLEEVDPEVNLRAELEWHLLQLDPPNSKWRART